MGIGFVLFFWILLGSVVAAVLSLGFGLMARTAFRCTPRSKRLRGTLVAVATPFLCLVYGVLAFMVYWIWCGNSRGVDPGLGDTWFVPLGSGYRLVMIDVPEQALIIGPVGRQLGSFLTQLGVDNRYIYFTSGDSFDLIDKETDQRATGLSRAELDQRVGGSRIRLQAPIAVYHSLRWSVLDIIAAGLIFGVPGMLCARVFWGLLRARRQVVVNGREHR